MKVVAESMRILIAYASRFGSARDIANRIASALRTDGSDVDVCSVDKISAFDRYDAVVFGSGVYDGSWTAEANELMRRYAAVLGPASPSGCSVLDRSAIDTRLSAN